MSAVVNITITVPVSLRTAAAIQSPDATANREQAISDLSASAALAAVEAVEALPLTIGSHGMGNQVTTLEAQPIDDSPYQLLIVKPLEATWVFDVSASMQVSEVKNLIAMEQGISPHQQRLVFKGREVEDHRTLGSYMIKNNDRVNLFVYPNPRPGASWAPLEPDMQIAIKTTTGREFPLFVNQDTPVAKVKLMIEQVEGVSPDHQRLICCGEELTDDGTLRDFEVCAEAVLHLVYRLRGS